MSNAMELTQRNLEQVGSYVRENLGTWIQDVSPPVATVQLDPAYLERIVRVEEELKAQRELMKQGFGFMEKRFEQMDKRLEQARSDTNARFEQMDKRFSETRADMKAGFEVARSHTNHWMTFLTIVLLVIGSAMTLVAVLVG